VRAAPALLALVLACGGGGDDTPGNDDTGGDSDTPMTGTDGPVTTGTSLTDGDGPSGEPCPLIGLYVECGADGRTYCDEIAGSLQFGPCLTELECTLLEDQTCTMRCELVDGVPTWIPQDICGSEESGGQ
jgi:hypothetical protein